MCVQYRTTKHERTGALKELPFIFDEDTIFAKFQHFSADLRKLAEIFKAKLQFDTLASQSIPGLDTICEDFATAIQVVLWGLDTICEDFASAIQVFRMRPYDPLHCTSSLFDRDCENMRAVVTALELDLQEFIHESFLQIESTDQALDLLGKFHALHTP
ncbi:dynein heavy chain, N-terminal region 1-domain-containing protein [Baffinella frigidus]|nr:dynein heavy chain, N-terminal region 1-domain-containing protein [Cryptophyta sp. CCMP2293]